MFFGGNEAGSGLAAVLFGDHNPSSKLPVTFREKTQDFPCHPYYPGTRGQAIYNEDIFVGYRSQNPSIGAFGFGLSYTTFDIRDPVPSLRHSSKDRSITIELSVSVKNTGSRPGAEVVQAYISAPKSDLPKAEIELAGFVKVSLEPGEEQSAKISFDRGAFSYWDVSEDSWVVDAGEYTLRIGNSSDSLPLSLCVTIEEGFKWRGL